MTPTPPPPPPDDPYADADRATWSPAPLAVYGRAHADAGFFSVPTGGRKEPYDAQRHALEDRRTIVTIEVLPVDPARFPVKRELFAQSKNWTEILRPSLQACGVTVRDLDGKYVEMVVVPDGRKYQDPSTGETKASTTVKLVRVFPDEASCFAAYQERQAAFRGRGGDAGGGPSGFTAAGGGGNGMVASGPPPPAGPSRETAAKFLPALWTQAGQDVARMAELLASNQLLSAHFQIDSPEVLAIVGSEAAGREEGAA